MTTRRLGPTIEAETVRVACREGGLAAAQVMGVSPQSVRKWCAEWRVPFDPPPPCGDTIAAAVLGLVRGFTIH